MVDARAYPMSDAHRPGTAAGGGRARWKIRTRTSLCTSIGWLLPCGTGGGPPLIVEVELGSVLAGCRIERLLGRGAMGAVYLGEDLHLRRKTAIKGLAREFADDERFRRRFLLESQL